MLRGWTQWPGTPATVSHLSAPAFAVQPMTVILSHHPPCRPLTLVLPSAITAPRTAIYFLSASVYSLPPESTLPYSEHHPCRHPGSSLCAQPPADLSPRVSQPLVQPSTSSLHQSTAYPPSPPCLTLSITPADTPGLPSSHPGSPLFCDAPQPSPADF